MKKLSIFLVLITLLAVIVGCTINEEAANDNKNNYDPAVELEDTSVYFSSLQDFKEYINNKEKQTPEAPMDVNAYMDFNSIIPDSEITEIVVRRENYYSVRYDNNGDFYYVFAYKATGTIADEVDEILKETPDLINKQPYDSIEKLKDVKEKSYYIWVDLGDYEIVYLCSTDTKQIFQLGVRIDGSLFKVRMENYSSSAQESFVKALNPDYGATDDSVIAMLDKIKALIPKS